MTAARATVVWVALVVVTALSLLVGGGVLPPRAALALVVGLAFVKAAVVGLEFAGLRTGPAAERRAFLAWIVVVGTVCTVLVAT